ncbi:5'-3' exoribonuclease [Acrasis kona]|uniref:5'-3' exoribonuclease n=1 Tax=Acrasis kona TaxID=1008807 RepID=A0AAW2YUV2_9EUKA
MNLKSYISREEFSQSFDNMTPSLSKDLCYIDVPYLRTKISQEMYKQLRTINIKTAEKIDYERLIDDFVLLSMLIGNDFLPNVPGIAIEYDTLSYMMVDYMKFCDELVQQDKKLYITEGDNVNVKTLLEFVSLFSDICDQTYYDNAEIKTKQDFHPQKQVFVSEIQYVSQQNDPKLTSRLQFKLSKQKESIVENQRSKSIIQTEFSESGLETFRNEYYIKKFNLNVPVVSSNELTSFANGVAKEFIRGIIFVWKYYTVGVPSWTWYYPYHYAPLATTLSSFNADDVTFDFKLGCPLRPFSQLLSVMPRSSESCLPPLYRSILQELPQYYPESFKRDPDFKKQLYKAIPLLPFINSQHLKEKIDGVKNNLSPQEKRRNNFGHTVMYFLKDENLDKQLNKVDSHIDNNPSLAITRHKFRVLLHESNYFCNADKRVSGYLYSIKNVMRFCVNLHDKVTRSPCEQYSGPVDFVNKAQMRAYFDPAFANDNVCKLLPKLVGTEHDVNAVVKKLHKEMVENDMALISGTKRKVDVVDLKSEEPAKKKRKF